MRSQREVLEYQARVFLFRQQFVNRGLRILAMRTLQVAEFHNGYGGIGRAARRAVGLVGKFIAGGVERTRPEGNNVANQGVLAVAGDVRNDSSVALADC